jgi:hypothetical protein
MVMIFPGGTFNVAYAHASTLGNIRQYRNFMTSCWPYAIKWACSLQASCQPIKHVRPEHDSLFW